MKFGIDRLVAEPALRAPLHGRRVALLAHPASVTEDLTHSLDALAACGDVKITAAFGPQHGLRGEKQDNMVESAHFKDPVHGIPVFSLYGNVRKPTGEMMDTFDVIIVDLQDLGCRIYTYITTLRYLLEAASQLGKAVWVLDRPNPVGRVIEGLTLSTGCRRRLPGPDASSWLPLSPPNTWRMRRLDKKTRKLVDGTRVTTMQPRHVGTTRRPGRGGSGSGTRRGSADRGAVLTTALTRASGRRAPRDAGACGAAPTHARPPQRRWRCPRGCSALRPGSACALWGRVARSRGAG